MVDNFNVEKYISFCTRVLTRVISLSFKEILGVPVRSSLEGF